MTEENISNQPTFFVAVVVNPAISDDVTTLVFENEPSDEEIFETWLVATNAMDDIEDETDMNYYKCCFENECNIYINGFYGKLELAK